MAKIPEKGRSPTAHRTKAQAVAHGRGYSARPEVKKRRAMRNAARRELMAEGKVHKGDGKDVHHVKDLKDGGTNARSNLRVVSQSKNRAHGKSKK